MTSYDQRQYNEYHKYRDLLHRVELMKKIPKHHKYKYNKPAEVIKPFSPLKPDDLSLEELLKKHPKYKFEGRELN